MHDFELQIRAFLEHTCMIVPAYLYTRNHTTSGIKNDSQGVDTEMPRRDRRPSNSKMIKNVCGSLDSPFTQVQERPTRSCTYRATISETIHSIFTVSLFVRMRYLMKVKRSSLHVCLSEKRIMHINDAMPIIHFRRMQPDGYSSRAFGVDVSLVKPPPHHPHVHVPYNRPMNIGTRGGSGIRS